MYYFSYYDLKRYAEFAAEDSNPYDYYPTGKFLLQSITITDPFHTSVPHPISSFSKFKTSLSVPPAWATSAGLSDLVSDLDIDLDLDLDLKSDPNYDL